MEKSTNQSAFQEADGMTSSPYGCRGWCARAERKRGAERARDREEKKKLPAGRNGVTNYDLSQEKNNNKSFVWTVTTVKLRSLAPQVSCIYYYFCFLRPWRVLKIGKIKTAFFSRLAARGRSPAPRLRRQAEPHCRTAHLLSNHGEKTQHILSLMFCHFTHTHTHVPQHAVSQ